MSLKQINVIGTYFFAINNYKPFSEKTHQEYVDYYMNFIEIFHGSSGVKLFLDFVQKDGGFSRDSGSIDLWATNKGY